MTEPTQHFFESQRLRLSYWDWGNASAPPLILVHGGRDHARTWDRVAEAFRDDHHVVALDLRGHGDSDWAVGSRYGEPDFVPDIVRLVELLGGRAALVAHSFGGEVSSVAAGTYPELFSAFVSIEGTSTLQPADHPTMSPAWMRMWSERARSYETPTPRVYRSVAEAAERIAEANPRLPADMVPGIAQYAVKPAEGGYVWKFDNWVHGRTSMEIRREDRQAFWSAIDCPALLFFGTESHIRHRLDPEDARFFKDARTVVVPGAGHWVHHDRPDMVIAEMRTFLAQAGA